MTITIDLLAPTIPTNRQVWRLFPGNGYQFLPTFLSERTAFLDTPAFPMPDGNFSDADDLTARLAYSQMARELLYKDGPDADFDLKLEDFSGAPNTKNRGRIRQSLINILQEAKAGDLVIMPTSLIEGRVWIGRFKDDDVVQEHFGKRYGRRTIPGRNVEWITSADEGAISSPLRKILRHQHPFAVIEKSLWVEVFAIAYSSFVFGDRHVSTIYNDEDFIDADASFLGNISKLASAACAAQDAGRKLDPAELLSLLLESPPIEYTSSQQVDIHSPGFNRYTSATIVALVTATLVTAFTVLPNDRNQIAPAMQQMVVMNSSADADPQCTTRVSAAQKEVFEVLGVDLSLKLCDAARKAKNRAGLRSSARPK